MKKIIFAVLILLSFSSWSQEVEKKFNFHLLVGGAYSRFRVGEIKTDSYPTLELRIGIGASRTITKRWAVNSGITVGMKFKRKSFFRDGNYYYGKGVPDKRIDETASAANHYFIEIPLTIQFSHSERLAFYTGILGRSWSASDSQYDFLRSQQEVGFLIGGTQELTKVLSVGIDLYTTLAPAYYLHTRNQFGQLKLIYNLGR